METNIHHEPNTKINKSIQTIDFVPIIHKFFVDVKTHTEATEFLKRHMNETLDDYSLFETRKIFYSLLVYKFGKELEYPETLQSKARRLILFVLKSNPKKEQRKIFKEFLDEFEKFRKEDFKNYMYELAVQYNQLAEMHLRLIDEPEWIASIQNLQDKILLQVSFSKGEKLFEECLKKLGKLKEEIIKEHLVNAYWDMMKDEISCKKYDLLMKNYLLIKKILLEMRDDTDTKEVLDEQYIQQLLDNDLFTEKTLLGQVDFIYHKMKIYGIPIYDKLIDKSKNNLIDEIQEKGLCPETITNVFRKILPLLENYIDIIRIYRERINKSKMEK